MLESFILVIYLFSEVIIEITDKSNHYSREYTGEKINTNIEDIFGWEVTRNHRAFTWGLPGTDQLNTYNSSFGGKRICKQ